MTPGERLRRVLTGVVKSNAQEAKRQVDAKRMAANDRREATAVVIPRMSVLDKKNP
jgi:hypothetical protein